MPLTDYKAKYEDLKAKFMETVDLSWRLGYEQGLKDAQLEQAQQQVQQAQDQANAMAAGMGQPGQEGEAEGQPGEQPEEAQPISQNPNGDDELGQHIEKLENMLGKSEDSLDVQELKKTLNDIRSLQVQINLTKSMESIKNTKLKKSFQPIKFTKKLEANLKEPAKKALSLQEDILKNCFAKWEKDESKAAGDIGSILNIEGLTRKG
jgi:hypothetical protein